MLYGGLRSDRREGVLLFAEGQQKAEIGTATHTLREREGRERERERESIQSISHFETCAADDDVVDVAAAAVSAAVVAQSNLHK